jgi:hypothetical protein
MHNIHSRLNENRSNDSKHQKGIGTALRYLKFIYFLGKGKETEVGGRNDTSASNAQRTPAA